MGIRSTTRRFAPVPKLRVTYFSCTLPLPQVAQAASTEVDGDDDKPASGTDFDDDFAGFTVECGTLDNVLDFPGCTVSLGLRDLAREDDVLEVKDGEVFIIEFVGGVGRGP